MAEVDLSVVVPVYNAEKWLAETMDALLCQTLSSIEIIAVDDGSTDGCPAALDEYAQRDARVRVIHRENAGVWRARETGVAQARGRYVGFCDRDDLPLPHMAERLVRAADEAQAEMAVCAFLREDMDSSRTLSSEMTAFGDRVYDLSWTPEILPAVNTAMWNKIIRVDVFKRAVHFDEPPRTAEDMMCLCSLYPLMRRAAFVSEPLYRYRVHSDSAMSYLKPEEIAHMQSCMRRVRQDVVAKTADARMLMVCDEMAFIHFGVAVTLRRVQSGERASEEAGRQREFLKKDFPYYRKAGGSLLWNIRNGGLKIKIWLVRMAYVTHLMGAFLSAYSWLTRVLGIDIKW